MDENPIYRHFTHSSGWPTQRQARWLAVGVGVLGGGLALAALYLIEADVLPFFTTLTWFLPASIIGSTILVPSLALIISALFAASQNNKDGLALIRLSLIPANQIADGYAAGAEYRLHVLRAAIVGLLPPAVVPVSYLLGHFIMIIDCFGPGGCPPSVIVDYFLAGSIPGIIIAALMYWNGVMLYRLAIHAGVWIGFRWQEKASTVAGSAILVVWLAFVPIVWRITYQFLDRENFSLCLPMVGIMPITAVTLFFLTRLARSRARRAVERR